VSAVADGDYLHGTTLMLRSATLTSLGGLAAVSARAMGAVLRRGPGARWAASQAASPPVTVTPTP